MFHRSVLPSLNKVDSTISRTFVNSFVGLHSFITCCCATLQCFFKRVYLFPGVTFPEGESDEPYDMQFCKWMIKEKVRIAII